MRSLSSINKPSFRRLPTRFSVTPVAGASLFRCHDLDRQGQRGRAIAFAQTRACGQGSSDDRFHILGGRRLAIGLPRQRSRRLRGAHDRFRHQLTPLSGERYGDWSAPPRIRRCRRRTTARRREQSRACRGVRGPGCPKGTMRWPLISWPHSAPSSNLRAASQVAAGAAMERRVAKSYAANRMCRAGVAAR